MLNPATAGGSISITNTRWSCCCCCFNGSCWRLASVKTLPAANHSARNTPAGQWEAATHPQQTSPSLCQGLGRSSSRQQQQHHLRPHSPRRGARRCPPTAAGGTRRRGSSASRASGTVSTDQVPTQPLHHDLLSVPVVTFPKTHPYLSEDM